MARWLPWLRRIRGRCGPTVGLAGIAGALGVAVALVPGIAGAAQTVPTTFGADLAARAPQSTATCETLYYQPTCTVTTNADQLGGTGESLLVPQGPDAAGSGTITAFHLAVGASTGPMQILLLQALRQSANSAGCCSVVNATPVFTPTANSVTTIPVNWATEADNSPNPKSGIYAFDLVALSVGAGVALPVAPQTNASDTFWAPACPSAAGTECDEYGGDERYVVTMNADWTPNAGATNPTPPVPNPNPVTPHPVPNLLVGTSQAVVKGNDVEIPLGCASALCIGTVQLQNFDAYNVTNAGVATAATRHVTYGKSSLRIGAGKIKTLSIKLNSNGRQLFKSGHSTHLWLNARLRDGRTLSTRITVSPG